jgi:hypothetical protein
MTTSTNLSHRFHRIAALLDEDERQSVLGDIEERGANLRALFDLIGLVVLRQLQAWKSWRPWALAASLYFPALSAAFYTHPIANILYSGHLLSYQRGFGTTLINPWELLAAPVFAWAIGLALGRLGHRRVASILLLLPAVFAWNIHSVARSTFFRGGASEIAPFTYFGPDSTQAARLLFFETSAFLVAVFLMFVLVVIPCIRGFARGVNDRPVSPILALVLVTLCLPAVWTFVWISYHLWPDGAGNPWRGLPVLWPLVYALSTSRRARTAYN